MKLETADSNPTNFDPSKPPEVKGARGAPAQGRVGDMWS
jgi:hypothetical protein